MNKIKKIFYVAFPSLLVVILILATFFDLNVSKSLAVLEDGNYISNNVFGRVFETLGECPLYVFITFSCAIILMRVGEVKNKTLSYLLFAFFFIGGAFSGFYMFNKISKYLAAHYEIPFDIRGTAFKIVYVCLGVLYMFLNRFLTVKFVKTENVKPLFYFAVAVILALGAANVIVQGAKYISGRMRYRAMYALGDSEFEGFTRWFIINGHRKPTEEQILNSADDIYKSFPSGHTCGASSLFALLILCTYFEKLNGNKAVGIFVAVSVLFVFTVAISRIMVGAHFLSDVTFASLVTITCVIVSDYIVRRFYEKFEKDRG